MRVSASKIGQIDDIARGKATPQLALDHETLNVLSKEHGASFFVLEPARFRANFKALHQSFSKYYPEVRIGYSYKTNYTPQLCRIAYEEGGYAEVVSEMEYDLAKKLDTPGPRIIFNGPYKSQRAFLAAAQDGAMINLDSQRDLELLQAASAQLDGANIHVVIRCNVPISDAVSRFGFDTSAPSFKGVVDTIRALPNVSLKGLHCHFPDRDLASFGRRVDALIDLLGTHFPDSPPDVLNIGGGYFSNMPESLTKTRKEPPATFSDYGRLIGQALTKFLEGSAKKPVLFLEPGTALVADTQMFYTKVISTKTVRGKGFATVAGSIFDISPNARAKTLPVTPVCASNTSSTVSNAPQTVVGYTCIEGDVLTEALPQSVSVGDFLAYGNVGSYSVVMRPPFILPSNPVLLQSEDTGELVLIKKRQSTDDVFQNFIF